MSSRQSFLCTSAALAAGAVTLHAQTIRQVPNHNQTGSTAGAVIALDDWNGADGIPEYAVGAPFDTTGGTQAGQVRVFDGASGALLRTINGTGFASCGGFPAGDQLGFDLTTLADLDGDGLRELLATRPGAPLVGGGGSCAGFHGGFMIIHSNPSTANFTHTSPTQIGLGDAAAGLDSVGGVPTFVVGTGNSVQVWQRPTFGLPPALISTIAPFAVLGTELCSAGTLSGLPAFATNASGGQVFVMTIAGANVQTISGSGSSFGSALARLNDAGFPPTIAVGEPSFSSGDGRAQVWQVGAVTPVSTLFGVPASAENFGADLGTGGDVDGDGDQDFVILAANGTRARIADRNGSLTANPIFLPAGAVGTALNVVPDMQSNGHDEVLVGGVSPSKSFIFFGGPDATVTSVGSSCDQGTGFLPVLSINSLPLVGSSPVIGQTGASPNSLSALFSGVIDPVGSPLGGCLVHLQASPAPVGVFTTITDAAGAWVAPALALPSPSLLGATAAFQAITFTSAGPFEFTNALDLRVGW